MDKVYIRIDGNLTADHRKRLEQACLDLTKLGIESEINQIVNDIKTVELDDAQIWLLITTCTEKKTDLEAVLKNTDGLNKETVQELQLRVRDLTDIIRELQFYAIDNK